MRLRDMFYSPTIYVNVILELALKEKDMTFCTRTKTLEYSVTRLTIAKLTIRNCLWFLEEGGTPTVLNASDSVAVNITAIRSA
jgi:hypothetical protein